MDVACFGFALADAIFNGALKAKQRIAVFVADDGLTPANKFGTATLANRKAVLNITSFELVTMTATKNEVQACTNVHGA